MRKEWCNEHIEETIENCGLSRQQAGELRRAVAFKLEHDALASISNKAIMPLIRIKDPETQAIAIESVVKLLESKKDDKSGKFTAKKERLVGKEIKATVERVIEEQKAMIITPEIDFEAISERGTSDKPRSKSKFNKTNDNIDWAPYSWNPVTGCKGGCPYCYAKDIAMHYTGHFNPEFHIDRLDAPLNTPFAEDTSKPGSKNVFVCSMADLFGDWVPQEWIEAVLKSVRDAPEWTFLFLTKNPRRMIDIDWPDNSWAGTTVDVQARVKDAEDAFKQVKAKVKFLSCEPLQELVTFSDMSMFNWLIIGGRSRSSGMPEGQPDWQWVGSLLGQAVEYDLKVYLKPNLVFRPKEFPE